MGVSHTQPNFNSNARKSDNHHWPLTESVRDLNPKYCYDKKFICNEFEGTTTTMKDIYNTKETNMKSSGQKQSRKGAALSPTYCGRGAKVEPRVLGGTNGSFLKINEHSHPVHWLNAILPGQCGQDTPTQRHPLRT